MRLMNECMCVISYRNFLLCDHNDAVGTPDPDRCQATLRDGFKGIFCKKDVCKNEQIRFNIIREYSVYNLKLKGVAAPSVGAGVG